MSAEHVRLDRQTLVRVGRGVQAFVTSGVGGKAKLGLAALVVLLFGINGLNVFNSYVGRDFMTSIAERSMVGFVYWGILYVGVFAGSTVAAVFYRFVEERLGLLWRQWLTQRLVSYYLEERTYYHLRESGQVENPDQRIAEDTRAFTATTLSFGLLFLNATFTIVAFAGVLWSISPLLFLVAAIYAVLGSAFTVAFGRPLIWLNYNQSDKEAALRGDLVHVRENAESIAILHREERLRHRLGGRLDELVANAKRIIGVNRNLGFFTTGYNYMIQIIPALIVAPLYIRGTVEFGVIPQASMAFSHLVGAFSLIVTQFQSISSYAAVVARLQTLVEPDAPETPTSSKIETVEEDAQLRYEELTLRSPRDGRVLIDDLRLEIPRCTNVLVAGDNQTAKIALFRATAGIWDVGQGRIVRPRAGLIQFLPERPYMPLGTLRHVLLEVVQDPVPSDEQILAILRALEIEPVLTRVGGLDVELDWDNSLSLGEQQLITVARIVLAAPQFVLLDRLSTSLDRLEVDRVLRTFAKHSITYVTFGRTDTTTDGHDAVLELNNGGSWKWTAHVECPPQP